MATVLDPGQPTAAAPGGPFRSERRTAVVLVVAVVVVASVVGAVVVRQRAATPEQFAAFAQQLDMYGPPSGPAGVVWTPLDPTQPGYNGPSGSDWQGGRGGTWTSTQDPSSWVAVHGWQASVSVADVDATCAAVEMWMTGTAAALGLSTTSDSPPSAARCRSVVATALAQNGAVSDAWAALGTQNGEGTMRYRTGSLVETTQLDPDHVTFTVMADATRFTG